MRRPGEELGGYVLVRQIGRGGMGTVYEAIDADDRRVALKLLHPQIGADPAARDRLRREVATLHRVRHTGVARVLDAEADSDEAFVVTELIDGQTLEDSVTEHGPFEADELPGLARGLFDAIAAIHAAGVVHRDVKPSNVMLTDDGPVLIDFGISQIADDVRYTQTGMVTGTPGYIDPQLVTGAAPSTAADWWGWAAVLVYAATGRPPFGRGPMPAVLARVTAGDVDVAGLAPALARAFRAALVPAPERRMRPEDLLAFLEGGLGEGGLGDGSLGEGGLGDGGTTAFPSGEAPTVATSLAREVQPTSVLTASPTLVVPAASASPTRSTPSAPPAAPTPTTAPPPPPAGASGSVPYRASVLPSAGTSGAASGTVASSVASARPPAPVTAPPPASATAPPPPLPRPAAAPSPSPVGGGAVVPTYAFPYPGRPANAPPGAVPAPTSTPVPAAFPGPFAAPVAPPAEVPTWARPTRPRPGLAVVGGLVAAGLAMVWPGLVAVVCASALVLASALGYATRSTRSRRMRAGPRRSDVAVASLASPLHVLRGALVSAVSVGLGVLAGIGVWWAVGLVTGSAVDPLGGPGGLDPRGESLAVGLAFLAAVTVAWLAPTSRPAREGTRTVLAVLPPRSVVSALVVVVAVVVVIAAVAVVASGATTPEWAPLRTSV